MAEETQILDIAFNVQTQQLQTQMGIAAATIFTAASQMVASLRRVTDAYDRMATSAVNSFLGQERALAELNTIFDGTSSELAQLDDFATQLSETFALQGGKVEALQALYQAVSFGATSMAEAQEVVNAAMIAGTAGLGDTETAVRAVASTLNAFAAQGETAEGIANKLFATVRVGGLRFEDIAANIGKVSGTAAQLGVSLDETLAAMAALTTTGISTEEAATAVNRALFELSKPGEDLEAAFRALGFETGRAAIEQVGFAETIRMLSEHFEKSGEDIFDNSESIRALRALLPLSTTLSEEFAASIESISGSTEGAGAAVDAFNVVADTQSFALQNARNRADKAAAALGESLAPATIFAAEAQARLAEMLGRVDERVIKYVGGLTLLGAKAVSSLADILLLVGGIAFAANQFNQLGINVESASNALGGISARTISTTGSLINLAAALIMSLGPWGLLVAAIVLVVAALILLQKWILDVTGMWDFFGAVILGIVDNVGALITAFSTIIGALVDLIATISVGIGGIVIALADWVAALLGLSGAWEMIKGVIVAAVGPIISVIQNMIAVFFNWKAAVDIAVDRIRIGSEAVSLWITTMGTRIAGVIDGITAKVQGLLDAIKTGEFLTKLGEWFGDVVAWGATKVAELVTFATSLVTSLVSTVTIFLNANTLLSRVTNWVTGLTVGGAGGLKTMINSFGASLMGSLWSAVVFYLATNTLTSRILSWVNSLVASLSSFTSILFNFGVSLAQTIWDGLVNFFSGMSLSDLLDLLGLNVTVPGQFLGGGGGGEAGGVSGFTGFSPANPLGVGQTPTGFNTGGGPGGGGITINVRTGDIRNEADIDLLVQRISDEVRRQANLVGTPFRQGIG